MKNYCTLKELAKAKDISVRTAHNWLEDGKIIRLSDNKGKKLCYVILKEALHDLVNKL